MNETVFVLFIIGIVMVSWMLHGTPKEGMETCSRPIRGPKDIDYPEVYGPSGRNGGSTSQSGGSTGSTSQSGGSTGSTSQTRGSTGQSGGSTGSTSQTGVSTQQSGTNDPRCSVTGQVQETPGGPIRTDTGMYSAWDDNDVMDSSTMTQNPLYASTFQFQVPSYKMDLSFPTEGPPQPYLTDFSRFHR
jgi:hypothetical protein